MGRVVRLVVGLGLTALALLPRESVVRPEGCSHGQA